MCSGCVSISNQFSDWSLAYPDTRELQVCLSDYSQVCIYTLLVCLSVCPFVSKTTGQLNLTWPQGRFMGGQNLERNYVFITNSNLLIQNKNFVRSNNLGSKYQKFTPSGCRDMGIRKLKFVAKTQFFVF